MKIFVTGATGFIGKHLVQKLAEKGHLVHALFRSLEKTKSVSHKNIKWLKGSLDDIDSLELAMKTCDQVYHTAAYAGLWAKDPSVFYHHNVTGTDNVLATAKKTGIKKVVYVSTAGVFNPLSGQVITENTPYIQKYFGHYERSKFEAEQLALQYAGKGLPVVVVYPTRVYGPGPLGKSNGTTLIMERYIRGRWHIIPGNGKSIGNYVFVDDVVNGLMQAMEHGISGEKYLLSGEDASFNDLINTISGTAGKTYRLYRIPQSVILLVSFVMVAYGRLTGTEPFITPGYVKKYSYDWKVSCDKARIEIGYMPLTLKQGITNTLEWIYHGYSN